MRKFFGRLLLVSPVMLTYLLVLTPAKAEEVEKVTEYQETAVSQAVESITVPATPTDVERAMPTLPEATPAGETRIAQATPQADAAAPAPVDTRNLQQLQNYGNEDSGDDSIDQITNASQFRDVQPSDWAFEALDRIVQRYGCLVGYPDGTYRGNRALSRYEFAAGLNACLRQIETLITNRPDSVSRTDFEALQRLTEEFRTELATLGTRLDNLESRTGFLEQRQFSTTTKLVGEAVFAITDAFGDGDVANTVFQDRVRLDFQSSFTGRDTLHTRIAASNANSTLLSPFTLLPGATLPNEGGTAEGTQTFNLTGGSAGNSFVIDWLAYYFPISSRAQVYVAATGAIHSDYVLSTVNPYLDSFTGATGALSHFAEENPIYSIGGGAGAGLSYKFSDVLGLSLGYLAGGDSSPANPAESNGLFDGDYAGLAQLNINPGGRFQLGLTYVNSYHTAGGPLFNLGGPGAGRGRFGGGTTGTAFANNPGVVFGVANLNNRIAANSYGAEASIQLSPKFVISGWFGYTNARAINSGDTDIYNYAVALAFPDLGKKGNLGGIIVGAEPYVAGFDNAIPGNTVPYHIEGLYKYQVTDNISITPGVIWLTAPNQNRNNPDVIIGTLRTTFTF